MLQKVLPYKGRIFEIPCYVRRWKKQLLFIGFHHQKVLLLHCFIKYEYGGKNIQLSDRVPYKMAFAFAYRLLQSKKNPTSKKPKPYSARKGCGVL